MMFALLSHRIHTTNNNLISYLYFSMLWHATTCIKSNIIKDDNKQFELIKTVFLLFHIQFTNTLKTNKCFVWLFYSSQNNRIILLIHPLLQFKINDSLLQSTMIISHILLLCSTFGQASGSPLCSSRHRIYVSVPRYIYLYYT